MYKDLTSYDALLEMIRREIINKELRGHQNKTNQGLLPPQMQRGKGSTSHLIDQHAKQSTTLNLRQAIAVATLNVVPTLAYKEINPNVMMY